MRPKMSLKSRKELLEILRAQYEHADSKHKQELLDSLVQATGYHRKYAITVLTQTPQSKPSKNRPRKYTSRVTEVLITLWEASNYLCGKRLVVFIPLALPSMEKENQIALTNNERQLLLTMSAATIDRHISENRKRPKSPSLTKAGSLSRTHIPVRTFAEWSDIKPGFLEIDTVGHCGGDPSGVFCHTLTLTDVSTGWTELFALSRKTEQQVIDALERSFARLPFDLKGIDSDNGTEFMNHDLVVWTNSKHVTFTKSRPYKKNDQCYVEQKNGAVVRKLTGHERYAGMKAVRILDRIYELASLYVNYFQPSMKLISRYKDGCKWRKVYDKAKTPFERLCGYGLGEQEERFHRDRIEKLNPSALLAEIRTHQRELLAQVTHPKDPELLFGPKEKRRGPFTGLTAAIANHIETLPHGKEFSAEEFSKQGYVGRIGPILRKMHAKGVIEKIGHGYYCRNDKTVSFEEMESLRSPKFTPELVLQR